MAIARVGRATTFPARFQLVAAMNPCPCGFAGDVGRPLPLPAGVAERYERRVSGPAARPDRPVGRRCRASPPAALVGGPRAGGVGRRRPRGSPPPAASPARARPGGLNGRLAGRRCGRPAASTPAADGGGSSSWPSSRRASGRGTERLLRVARTIADLAGSPAVAPSISTRRPGSGRPLRLAAAARPAECWASARPGRSRRAADGSADASVARPGRRIRRRGARGLGRPRCGPRARAGRVRRAPRRLRHRARRSWRRGRPAGERLAARRPERRRTATAGAPVGAGRPRRSPRRPQDADRDARPDPRARPARRDPRRPGLSGAARARSTLPPHVLFVRGDVGGPRRRARGRGRRHAPRRPSAAALVAARIARRSSRPARRSCPGLAVGIDGAAHAAPSTPAGRRSRSSARGHGRLYPAGPRRLADGDRRGRRSGRVGARARHRADARARSRGATGSSAASPTPRSSSRRRPGAAR